MKLTFESDNRQLVIENVDEQRINDVLKRINPGIFGMTVMLIRIIINEILPSNFVKPDA